jgi:hypothetical protein
MEGLQYFFQVEGQKNNKKNQEKEEFIWGKRFGCPLFPNSISSLLLFVLNDSKSYGCAIWSTLKGFGSVETMKQWTKSLNSKTQIILMSLNQTLIPFTSKGHILLIRRPILTIFAALDMLGGGLQNLLKFWKQHSNVQKSMNVYPPLYPHYIMCYNYISITMFIPYCAIIWSL